MSQQAEKLKKKAAEFEAKRQMDKAIATYLELFKLWDSGTAGVDVALYNRVGDMLIRAGNIGDAMSVWEQAVDYYSEGGFQNNAIALCNKILRHSPGRTSIYYKLGKMSAQKGFKSDAKKNYLEYADRMQKANQMDEAFRALKEFADLCPDEDDIRQALAEQFAKLSRNDEAIEQLQFLYERYETIGDAGAAAATLERMRKIDPSIEPKRGGATAKSRASSGLVFLDVDTPVQRPARKSTPVAPPRPAESKAKPKGTEGLPLIDMGDDDEPVAPPPPARKSTPIPPVQLEPLVADTPAPVASVGEIPPLDIETTSIETPMLDAALIDLSADDPPVIESILDEPIVETPSADLPFIEPMIADVPSLETTAIEPIVFEPTASEPIIEAPVIDEPVITVEADTESAVDLVESIGISGAYDAIQVAPEPTPEAIPEPIAESVPEPIPATPLRPSAAIERPADFVADPPIVATPSQPFPVVTDVTFGASFGTEEGAIPIEPSSFGTEVEIDAVSSSLSSPEDSSFGTLGSDAHGLGDSSEPELIEFMPGLDVSTPMDASVTQLPGLDFGDAFALTDDSLNVEPSVTDSQAAAAVTDDVAAPAPVPEPVPSRRRTVRPTMSVLAQSVDLLRVRLASDPKNWQLHREFGEALLEDGDRAGGLAELESAMVGFERAGELDSARSVADEIIRLNPLSVRHHQRRVEYAFRMNDRPRLIEAYVELADALFREGQAEKSRVVYERVLELAPDDARALAALSAFVAPPRRASGAFRGSARISGATPAPRVSTAVRASSPVAQESVTPPPATPTAPPRVTPPGAPRVTPTPQRLTPLEQPRISASQPRLTPVEQPRVTPMPATSSDFVNLEDMFKDEEEQPKSTRMVVEEKAPTGDETADFNEMLRKFKQGVAQNVEDEDHESHYDLGIAYKEMGLVEEAIAEFQKALRGPKNRVRTYEALGLCFVEKGQHQVAMTILQRALSEPGATDEQLIGVLYLLGVAGETLRLPAEALKYFQRVFAVDINFRDVSERLRLLEQAGR